MSDQNPQTPGRESVPGEAFPAVPRLPEEEPLREEGAFDATVDEQLRGLVAQVRADRELRPGEDPGVLLAQRLRDAAVDVGEDEYDELLAAVSADGPTVDLEPGVRPDDTLG